MKRKPGVQGQALPRWVEVRSQSELERALSHEGTIPICLGDGSFSVQGTAWVFASDTATVAIDAGFVQAGSGATIVAGGTVHVSALDRAMVVAKDEAKVWASDRVTVEASGDSRVAAWNRGSFAPTVHALAGATVEATGTAVVQAHGEAMVLAHRRAVVNAEDQAVVCAWDEAIVHASGSAHVYASGRSRVDAHGDASVDAWQSAGVRAHGSSEVRARGATTVELQGRASVMSTPHVTVLRRARRGQEVEHSPSGAGPTTPLEWCSFHGVDVVADAVTLYKAVDDDYRSTFGTIYAPGSMPETATWDGGERECGNGLHLCPHPSLALQFAPQATRFVACPVMIGDLAPNVGRRYLTKTKARRISAPVYEVDLDGSPA